MESFKVKLAETTTFLTDNIPFTPEIAVVLGSGFSDVAMEINNPVTIPYSSIPHMKETAVQTHKGNLVAGEMGGKKAVCFQGRIHIYEGYDLLDIAFHPLVACLTGARVLVTTNLVGGINKDLKKGDFVVITDHLNLSSFNPLIALGKAMESAFFVDMYDAYSKRLRNLLKEAAVNASIQLKEGRLAFLPGLNFETKMELEFLKSIGSDVVSWSMVPEVLVARSHGLEVSGISCVSDISDPECYSSVDVNSIFEEGKRKVEELRKLLNAFCLLL